MTLLNETALEAAGHEPHCALREHAGAETAKPWD